LECLDSTIYYKIRSTTADPGIELASVTFLTLRQANAKIAVLFMMDVSRNIDLQTLCEQARCGLRTSNNLAIYTNTGYQ